MNRTRVLRGSSSPTKRACTPDTPREPSPAFALPGVPHSLRAGAGQAILSLSEDPLPLQVLEPSQPPRRPQPSPHPRPSSACRLRPPKHKGIVLFACSGSGAGSRRPTHPGRPRPLGGWLAPPCVPRQALCTLPAPITAPVVLDPRRKALQAAQVDPRAPSSSSGFPHRLPSWLDWGDSAVTG